MGLVSDPAWFRRTESSTVPITTPPMMRQEPMPVTTSTTAPSRQASADVSPMEPGTSPRKACRNEAPSSAPGIAAARARCVAPLKPSTPTKSAAIHGASPLISAG
jgi:hypothetical protein